MQLKTIAVESHAGPLLQLNEDGYEFDLNKKVFMVLDAFGGSGAGDVTLTFLKENLKKFYTQISADPNATLPFFYSPKFLIEGNALINSMLYTHNLLMHENQKKEISKRGGASAIIATMAESILTLSSVGNCCAYLLRRGSLTKLFIEDSFLYLSNDDYDSHLKTIPLSGFGLFPDLYYQVKEVRIFEGDSILLMTDGVYARILAHEIKDILSKNQLSTKLKIKQLFKLANQRGNLDNQTAMILDF